MSLEHRKEADLEEIHRAAAAPRYQQRCRSSVPPSAAVVVTESGHSPSPAVGLLPGGKKRREPGPVSQRPSSLLGASPKQTL